MRILPLALAALTACATCPPAAYRRFAERVDDLGIENVGRIAPGIYRGAQPTEAALRTLKERGFKTVVNLRSHHSEREAAERIGLRAIEIPERADILGASPPGDDEIRRFFETLLEPANQPVFFHCAHGCDRTGTMAALYRIEIDGWTPDEAVEEMRAFGFHETYRVLLDFVRGYRARGYGGRK